MYRNWRRHATYQKIVVKRGNLKLKIVNPRTNTGVCHYVTSGRKTLFVGSNKWEFIGLVDSGFSGFSLHRRNF